MSWDAIIETVADNRLVQCALILAASLVGAWIADRLLGVVFRRWARRTSTELDDQVLAILRRPVRVSVVLIGLAVITLHMEGPPHAVVVDAQAGEVAVEAAEGAVRPLWARFARGGLATVAILVWLGAALRLTGLLFPAAERRFEFVEPRTLPLFTNLAKVLLVGAGIYFMFLSWGLDLTGWVASAGIIGIAVGFAAKDTLANLIAGLFVSADAPYQVGDFINLDSGDRGMVTDVGIRSTRLLTRDDIEITLPNSVIANAKIINESGGRWEKERLRIKVGVAYGSDVDQVREILMAVAVEQDEVCAEPEPRVRFRQFGESSLDFELLAWIGEPVLRGRVIDALNTEIYKRFASEGVEIPYPKRDLYIRQLPEPRRGQESAADEGAGLTREPRSSSATLDEAPGGNDGDAYGDAHGEAPDTAPDAASSRRADVPGPRSA